MSTENQIPSTDTDEIQAPNRYEMSNAVCDWVLEALNDEKIDYTLTVLLRCGLKVTGVTSAEATAETISLTSQTVVESGISHIIAMDEVGAAFIEDSKVRSAK